MDAERASKAGSFAKGIDENFKVNHDDYYILLVVAPELVDSYECVNILNYFGFPINVEEDNILRQTVKKEMGFTKEDPYPVMIIDSAIDSLPEADLNELNTILGFLKDHDLIGDVNSHSAKEAATMRDFLLPEVEPILQAQLSSLKQKMLFYSAPRHFRQTELEREVSDFFKLYMGKLARIVSYKFQPSPEAEVGALSKKESV
mmetsp:Transcript_24205/g.37267  ORF Transcript_24205/g.37267 Transcript_24205/m.37267 type:complete len:203 (-) Transcript_24205:226-834(-)|eukprot:CAMPEP_0170499840 /NCGR_PEP_ID=MMETSP0208-20121228/32821_1 /TAXON_ID=197538 /ORGANISM="Strombidium inclinatum, Strain S3" /LENGTH=202 /DNA_ID=CAMNT_0010777579 /DNA_START=215 /DNA_END=823 /DNA_ORIENTATION=+